MYLLKYDSDMYLLTEEDYKIIMLSGRTLELVYISGSTITEIKSLCKKGIPKAIKDEIEKITLESCLDSITLCDSGTQIVYDNLRKTDKYGVSCSADVIGAYKFKEDCSIMRLVTFLNLKNVPLDEFKREVEKRVDETKNRRFK